MLGHGTPYGLLAGGIQKMKGDLEGRSYFTRFHHYIVDGSLVEALRGKDTFSIWCNSDKFFSNYGLRGLHTGMIISELQEEFILPGALKAAPWTPPLNEEQMAKNMELFCGAFAKYIDLPPEECRKKVLEEYVGEDEVTQYNRERILVL